LGWLHPQHTTAFVSIIPRGQEAELMGMYLLCGQFFAWLPPMVFTLLNEMGYPMTYGLASLAMFFIAGIFCILMMSRHNLPICSSMSDSNLQLSPYDAPPPNNIEKCYKVNISETKYVQLHAGNLDRKRSDSPESIV
jgi:ABC-type transport system involved in multi-copper enzyme maturation permease subunit